jgi:hypothetical protein
MFGFTSFAVAPFASLGTVDVSVSLTGSIGTATVVAENNTLTGVSAIHRHSYRIRQP